MFRERRRLGRTGLMVSAIGLGGVGVGGLYGGDVTDRDCDETVALALSEGINFIDTSPLYLESERRLGAALAGVPRDSYYLSTKTGTHPERRGDFSREGTLWSVENSLRLLQTDYVDLLLIHDPESLEPVLAPGGALDTLEELKADGVVHWIGLGQRRHDFHQQAIATGRIDVILTFNDYHVTRTTALTGGLLTAAQAADVGVLNGSPMAHGLLGGDDPRTLQTHHMTERDTQAAIRLYDWCRVNGVNQRAVVLQSCLRQLLLHSTLTGAKSAAELRQNLDATRTPLPETLWQEIAALDLTAGQV